MEESEHRPRHRGAHPEDKRLFGVGALAKLRAATSDLGWLLERGYPVKSALILVGDRYTLHERQRLAVVRSACSDAARIGRNERRVPVEALRGESIIIDGFNLLITLEAALSGGVLLGCIDGCYRDIASVHGTYRSVEETDHAISLAGDALANLAPGCVLWVFDKPVSNSGRLAERLRETAAAKNWEWTVELAFSPDMVLRNSDRIAVTSDSTILDNVTRWTNLAAHIVDTAIEDAWLIDMS